MNLLFTHKNCYDGAASKWVFKKKYPDSIIIDCLYDERWMRELDKTLVDNKITNLYFIDFAPNKEQIQKLKDLGFTPDRITILDHHATTVENMMDEYKDSYRLDMNECGATIAWKYFFPGDTMPELLDVIRMGDTWKFSCIEDEYANAWMRYLLQPNDSIEKYADVASWFKLAGAKKQGEILYNQKWADAKYIASMGSKLNFNGTIVHCVNSSHLLSEVGKLLADRSSNNIGVCYTIKPEIGKVLFSVRGDNAKEFADKMGGGGHPKAAGFKMSIDDFFKLLKEQK